MGTLVLSRLYHPDSFGTLGYYSGFASIIAIISGLRFDYIVFSRESNEKKHFFSVAFILALLLNIIIFILLLLSKLAEIESNKASFWLLLFCISSSLFHLSTQLLIAYGEYNKFARVRLLQAFLQIIIGAVFYQIFPKTGLLLAFSISQLCAGILILIQSSKLLLHVCSASIIKCWKENVRTSVTNSVVILLQYSTPFAPVFIGTLHYNENQVGAFFLFSSGYSAALAIFRRSLVNFLNGEVTTPIKFHDFFVKPKVKIFLILSLTLFMISLLIIILNLFDDTITALIFGRQWIGFSNYLVPIFLFFLLDSILQPFTTLLPLWGKQSTLFKYELIRFLAVFVGLPLLAVSINMSFYQVMIVYFNLMTLVYLMNIISVYRVTIYNRPATQIDS